MNSLGRRQPAAGGVLDRPSDRLRLPPLPDYRLETFIETLHLVSYAETLLSLSLWDGSDAPIVLMETHGSIDGRRYANVLRDGRFAVSVGHPYGSLNVNLVGMFDVKDAIIILKPEPATDMTFRPCPAGGHVCVTSAAVMDLNLVSGRRREGTDRTMFERYRRPIEIRI